MHEPDDFEKEAIRQAARENDRNLPSDFVQRYLLDPNYMFTFGCGCLTGIALTVCAFVYGWFGLRAH